MRLNERQESPQTISVDFLITKDTMKDWKTAFYKTIPVMCGYLFLGMAFGILLQQAGFSPIWAAVSSLLVYAGSMQFVMISLMSSGASLPLIGAMTLLVNSRHLFYGLSFIEKFREFGKKWFYMVFSLTDETYSVFCGLSDTEKTPALMFKIALLDQSYWVLGSAIGALAGAVIPFDTTGIDFAMTALFVVIFIEQWQSFSSHLPAIIGLCSSVLFLAILGADQFILPSLVTTVLLLMMLRDPIVRREEGERNE